GTTPGVQPNTGLAVNAGGSARSMEKERNRERLIGEIDKTVEISDQMRNGLLGLSASINVPRSYFVAIFKQTQDGKEPTDADLTTLIQEELKKIKGQALTLMAATDDPTRVQVDWFTDTPPMGVLAAEAAAQDDMLGWVKAYGGHAGLGALAIVSMLLMVMMVRKASEGPILPGEEPPPPIFGGGRSRKRRRGQPEDDEPEEILTAGMPIGEAQATGGLLVGHEVDEQSVRSQQLAEQVTELVEDNPTVAANLIKRWVESAR
ncbi:MAG: hypothetical protein JXA69_06255, partial [Phycisphaerae bacterium]|nr:hypothetical protein [Phycisphaerae bacterium]